MTKILSSSEAGRCGGAETLQTQGTGVFSSGEVVSWGRGC